MEKPDLPERNGKLESERNEMPAEPKSEAKLQLEVPKKKSPNTSRSKLSDLIAKPADKETKEKRAQPESAGNPLLGLLSLSSGNGNKRELKAEHKAELKRPKEVAEHKL